MSNIAGNNDIGVDTTTATTTTNNNNNNNVVDDDDHHRNEEENEQEVEWNQWTCDELTPDLCDDLEMSLDTVNIRGVDIQIWKYYTRRQKKTKDDSSSSSSQSNPLLPIINIHGGPAWPHNYMLPLKQQACRGRDVYFYDQAGCGQSKLPITTTTTTTTNNNNNSSRTSNEVADHYPWLLTTEYYSQEELPTIIDYLQLDKYHIIGSSWGTILSQYFALDTPRVGLASMVLSGPLSDGQAYIDAQWDEKEGNLGNLPPYIQERIHALEESKEYDSTEYEAIGDILTTKFTCRTAPLPDCFVDSSNGINTEIYVGMQGPSEFTFGGVLGNFNITHRLSELSNLPVLLTHGKYDTMRPSIVDAMYKELPLGEKYYLTKSGHVSMIDEPQLMNDVIADFFDRVEESISTNTNFVPQQPTSEVYCSSSSSILDEEESYPANLLFLTCTILVAFFVGAFLGRRTMNRKDYSPL